MIIFLMKAGYMKMSGSTMATIFLVALVVFFILLIIMTVAVIASKSKNNTEDDEYENTEDDEDVIKPKRKNKQKSIDDEDDNEIDIYAALADASSEDETISDSAFADSAFSDSAFSDSAFADSAFSDNTSSDSAFDADEDYYEDEDYNPLGNDDITEELAVPGVEPVGAVNDSRDEELEETESDSIISDNLEDVHDDNEPENELKDSGVNEDSVQDALSNTIESEPVTSDITQSYNENEAPDSEKDINESDVQAVASTSDEQTVSAPEQTEEDMDVPVQSEELVDSAFAPEVENLGLTDELIAESVKEAEAMAAVVIGSSVTAETMFGISEEMSKFGSKKKNQSKSTVSSDEDFYWYNRMDVADKPSYKTAEMYYHYFNLPQECIEDLLIEMYDCALVRTEEIKYIAYGIEPRAVSMKDILSNGNGGYGQQQKVKEPTTQDLVRIYEKWCGYVDKLFDQVEIHADDITIEAIRKLLCEYGRSDVDVLIEGK